MDIRIGLTLKAEYIWITLCGVFFLLLFYFFKQAQDLAAELLLELQDVSFMVRGHGSILLPDSLLFALSSVWPMFKEGNCSVLFSPCVNKASPAIRRGAIN